MLSECSSWIWQICNTMQQNCTIPNSLTEKFNWYKWPKVDILFDIPFQTNTAGKIILYTLINLVVYKTTSIAPIMYGLHKNLFSREILLYHWREKWVEMIFFQTFNSTWKNGKTFEFEQRMYTSKAFLLKDRWVRLNYSRTESHCRQDRLLNCKFLWCIGS